MKMLEFISKYSQKFAPKDLIDKKPVLVQIIAWHQAGD